MCINFIRNNKNSIMKFNKIFLTAIFLCMFTVGYSQNNTTIKPVLNAYLGLKDALVATNNEQANISATTLVKALSAVITADLNTATNNTWSKVSNDVINAAKLIQASNDISVQRDQFVTLSSYMYLLIKDAKNDVPVYYQFCPMANKGKGANWLSLENKVKNPYYGSRMLSCGKVVETL
jgi:hypothetical protein